MRTTITIRAAGPLRARLARRAAATGRTLSEIVREALERALAETAAGERAAPVRGRLRLPRRPEEPWRERLRSRNWRP